MNAQADPRMRHRLHMRRLAPALLFGVGIGLAIHAWLFRIVSPPHLMLALGGLLMAASLRPVIRAGLLRQGLLLVGSAAAVALTLSLPISKQLARQQMVLARDDMALMPASLRSEGIAGPACAAALRDLDRWKPRVAITALAKARVVSDLARTSTCLGTEDAVARMEALREVIEHERAMAPLIGMDPLEIDRIGSTLTLMIARVRNPAPGAVLEV